MDDANERGLDATGVPPASRKSEESKRAPLRVAPEMQVVLDQLAAMGVSRVFRDAATALGRLPSLWPRHVADRGFCEAYGDAGGTPNGGQYAKDLAVLEAATWRTFLGHVAGDDELGVLVLADVSGDDMLGLGAWLVAHAEAFIGEQAAIARAVALAHSWSGPVFALEVRRVAMCVAAAGDDRPGALLALAAAHS